MRNFICKDPIWFNSNGVSYYAEFLSWKTPETAVIDVWHIVDGVTTRTVASSDSIFPRIVTREFP